MIIKASSLGMQLGGVVRKLWRAIRRQPASDMGICVEVIPPYVP
ncbi:MAG: hypothetical protein ACYCZF_16230 [Anaerolineae bacterium]